MVSVMRAITRHVLTGALLAATALGVITSAEQIGQPAGAETRMAVPATQHDGAAAPEPVPMLDRADLERHKALRQESRQWHPTRNETRTAPSAPARGAVAERNAELDRQRKQAEQTDEDLQRIAEQGYDPKTATTPREIGQQLAANLYGWTGSQWQCYDNLIMSESRWVVDATNPTSGAYGIPQSLPGSKMASEGQDWRTNPATQIRWGLKYVQQRYGTPCAAWSFKQARNYY